MRALSGVWVVTLSVVVLAACNDGTTGDPPTLDELPDRIAAAQEANDLMVVLGCTPEHWRDSSMDFEGTADRPTAEEAAAVVLDDGAWEAEGLPGGERVPLYDQMFRVGAGLLLPVLVDGEVKVLVGYDRQGPDVWSVGGVGACFRMP